MENLKSMKVLVAELLDSKAIEKLEESCTVDVKYKLSREEMLKIIPEYNAITVRSETQVDKEFLDAAVNLKIVGRGGSGLDNIDIDYATKKGVIVANTPESNIISAAEHTIALLLGTSRNVAWANSFIKQGQWDRKRFKGSEIYQKTIAIIGLGRIGGLIATRLKAFDPKKIIAYDPYITEARFEKYGVEKKNSIEDLVKEADFITIHTPRTKETIGIISDKEIELMKDGVRLVNVARGGLYDEDALVRGMESGKIASVGIDVWKNEPQLEHGLYKFDTSIGTPHLGASTFEAQVRVGAEVVSEVIAGLKGEMVKNAVNIPSVSELTFKKLEAFITLSEKIGKLYAQISNGTPKKIELVYSGNEIDKKEDVKILSLLALKGILDKSVPETVNFVNATLIAEQRGIDIKESIQIEKVTDYANMVKLVVEEEEGSFEISGTVMEGKHPRIIKIQNFVMDFNPQGRIIYAPHKNVPGVIGKVGILIADYNVNISNMIVSDSEKESMMILTVDNEVPSELADKLMEIDEILDIKVAELLS